MDHLKYFVLKYFPCATGCIANWLINQTTNSSLQPERGESFQDRLARCVIIILISIVPERKMEWTPHARHE